MQRISDESHLWGVIPYRVVVPVLLVAALTLTVVLVVTLESWHAAVSAAIELGSHPQDIPRSDLIKVASLVFLLGATTVVSLYILQTYRNTQHQLSGVQQLSRYILDNVVTGVLTFDAAGTVLMANPRARQILDLPSEETAVDLPSLESLHPQLGKILRAAVDRDEHVQDRDISTVTPAGETTWLRITTTPLPVAGPQRVRVIVLVKDVTQLLSVEKQLRRLDRLAVTETLAAGVAHEIRNPLTAIGLNLRSLRGEVAAIPPDRDEIERYFEILTEETRRLNHITEQFLTFSRRGASELRRIAVAEVVEHVLHLIAPEVAEKRIELETAIPAGLEPVRGDPERLEQVFLNILVNAMESMPDGGCIHVELLRSETVDGRWIEVHIRDRGPGLAEENLTRLFDPYFTTKQSGNGLGLAIAHRILTDHDGEIGIENARGGGALVRVRLPVAPAEEAA